MGKTAFVGFGEVNTPVDIIVNKCKAAEEALKGEGLDLVSVYPVTDDYEEKDIKKDNFNPFRSYSGENLKEYQTSVLNQSLARAYDAYNLITLIDFKGIFKLYCGDNKYVGIESDGTIKYDKTWENDTPLVRYTLFERR